MPTLDVSDAFDPDFLDILTRVRQDEVVGDNGRATRRPVRTSLRGVITNDSGDMLHRGADAARVSGSINVTGRFDLRMDGLGFDADLVEWDGRVYTVINVKDYGRYGVGYCTASCQVIKAAG